MPGRNPNLSSSSIWSISSDGFPRQKAASRDQRKLLEQPDAWASKLQQSQHGFVNVPAQVLGHIIAFNSSTTPATSRNAESAAEGDTNTDKGVYFTGSPPPKPSSPRVSTIQTYEQSGASSLPKPSDGHLEMLKRKRSIIGSPISSPSQLENLQETDIPGPQTQDDSKKQRTNGPSPPNDSRYSSTHSSPTRDLDEDQVSWAASSPRQPQREIEYGSQVGVQSSSSSPVPASPANGSAKKTSMLESILPSLPSLRRNGPIAVTQSTSGSEPDLEMAIPHPFNSPGKSVNRSAAVQSKGPVVAAIGDTNTPPCGQPVPGSSPVQHSPQKNPRRMRPVKFSESPQQASTRHAVAVPTSFARPPTLEFPSHQVLAIASQDVSVEESASMSSGSAAPSPDGTYVEQGLGETTSLHESVTKDVGQGPQTLATPLTPFDAFVSAYSTYQGSLDVFVKACMCLKVLKRQRALPEFLYDDFIRAFSDGYLDYVSGFEEHKSPLPAIAWYNSTVKEPEYTGLIFDGDDLEEILSTYSEQVNEARVRIGGSALKSQETDEMAPGRLVEEGIIATALTNPLTEPQSVSTQNNQSQWRSVSMQTEPEEVPTPESDQQESNTTTKQQRYWRSVSTQTEEVKNLDPQKAAEDGVVATLAKRSVFDSPQPATVGAINKNLTPATHWEFDAPQPAISADTSDKPIPWSEKGKSTIRDFDAIVQDEVLPNVPLGREKFSGPGQSTPAPRKFSEGPVDTPQQRSASSAKSKQNSTPSSVGKKYLGSDYLRQLSRRSAVTREGKHNRPKHQRLTEYLEKYMREKGTLASIDKPQRE